MHRTTRRFKFALSAGILLTAVVWGLLLLAYPPGRDGWITSRLSLAYNVPIMLVFFVLGGELLLSLPYLPLRKNLPFVTTWFLGAVILWARIGLQLIAVSVHLTWLVMMFTHAITRDIPQWFTALIGLVLVEAVWINFTMFSQQTSGERGIVAGAVLSLLLWALQRWLDPGERLLIRR